MKTRDDRPEQDASSASSGQDLRRQAEAKARINESQTQNTLSPEETRQTLHELRVHQIELEIQNEELRRAQAELDAARARYFDLYDLAPVGYCTLSEPGLILEANLTAVNLLGVARVDLVKQPLSRFILKEDQDIYYLHRKQLFETHSTSSLRPSSLRQAQGRQGRPASRRRASCGKVRNVLKTVSRSAPGHCSD